MEALADIALGVGLLLASLLVGVVVAIEAVVIVSFLTMPAVGAITRWLPWQRDAARRAEALLRSLLTGEEYRQLCQLGYVEIASPSHGNRRYRIPRQRGTIDVYEGDYFHSTLCIAPVMALPDDDIVAAHKLMILSDEQHYLATANRVVGCAWDQPALTDGPYRPRDRATLPRLLLAAALAMAGALLLLQAAGLPVAALTVLAVVVGWPLLIGSISILTGLAILVLRSALTPQRSSHRSLAGDEARPAEGG